MRLQVCLGTTWLIASVALVWICHGKVRDAKAEVDAAYEFCNARLAANNLYHQQQCARVVARAETTEEAAEETMQQASEARDDAIEKLSEAIRTVRRVQRTFAATMAENRMAEGSVADAHRVVKDLHAKINFQQQRIVQREQPMYR